MLSNTPQRMSELSVQLTCGSTRHTLQQSTPSDGMMRCVTLASDCCLSFCPVPLSPVGSSAAVETRLVFCEMALSGATDAPRGDAHLSSSGRSTSVLHSLCGNPAAAPARPAIATESAAASSNTVPEATAVGRQRRGRTPSGSTEAILHPHAQQQQAAEKRSLCIHIRYRVAFPFKQGLLAGAQCCC